MATIPWRIVCTSYIANLVQVISTSRYFPTLPRFTISGGETRANTMQAVNVNPKPSLRSTSLNWDAHPPGTGYHNAPILSPRDVVQVAFILEHETGVEQSDIEEPGPESDNKRLLGQLAIQWRGALGDRGSLSTGWLMCRR